MSFFFSSTPKNVYGDLRLGPTERQLYDTLWKQANPQGAARIGAVQAVEFLSLSGISPVTLASVWELTALNEQGQDYYDRNAFDAALRLIGHAQKGLDLTVALLTVESRPVFDTSSLPNVQNQSSEAPPAAWPPLPVGEMKAYRDLFKNLDKENGLLDYDVVLQILLKTGQPTAILANVLALVDRSMRAGLDEDEFVMAMYFAMCLKKRAIAALPPSLPAEVKQICQVKELPSPNAELNYYNVLFNPNPNASERRRELLAILQQQQQQQEKLQEVYLKQILENSKTSEQRMYQQSIDHSRATQEQFAPLLAAGAFGDSRYAAIFAESYNNAAKQQQELMERLMAASNPLPTTLPQVPAENPPVYSAQQTGAFSPTALHQQQSAFSPVPSYQQQYPQYPQYQQQPLQAYPVQQQQQQQPLQAYPVQHQQQQQPLQAYPVQHQQQQQPLQAYPVQHQQQQQPPLQAYPVQQQQQQQPLQAYPVQQQQQQQPLQAYPVQQQQQQQQVFQPQDMPAYSQQQQYSPYAQYTQPPPPNSLGKQGVVPPVSGYQSYPPPPQGSPQYQSSAPGLQQHPMSPGNPQQQPMSPGNPQQQPLSPGSPQYQFAQGQPARQQQQYQQPLSPGGPQQYIPPRHPQIYAQQQEIDPLNAPLPSTPTSPAAPPVPSRAPQDRNDYSIAAAVSTLSMMTTTAVSSVPPPLPSRRGQQQQQQQPGNPQGTAPVRAPQYREPIPEEARRPIGAPQLR